MADIYGYSGELEYSFWFFSILSPCHVTSHLQRPFFTLLTAGAKHFQNMNSELPKSEIPAVLLENSCCKGPSGKIETFHRERSVLYVFLAVDVMLNLRKR